MHTLRVYLLFAFVSINKKPKQINRSEILKIHTVLQ